MFISNVLKALVRFIMKKNVKTYPLLKLGYSDREFFS